MIKTTRIWRSLRLALVALLIIAFGCEQTPQGRKLGAFYPTDAITSVAFTPTIAISAGHHRSVWAGVAAATLVRAASGHTSGGQYTIEFPANTATSLALPQDFNCKGDFIRDGSTALASPWDATKPHLLNLEQIGAYTQCALVELATPDVSAATIVSVAAVFANPNAVTITWSEPVWFGGATTGITTPFTVGTARTITGLEAGDGTSSTTFTLSGNLDGSEAFKVVVGGGRTATDLDGNTIATNVGVSASLSGWSSTLVSKAAWTRCFESAQQMLPSAGLPANFTSWTDQVGASLQILPSAAGNAQRTAAPNASLKVTPSTDQRNKVAAALSASNDFAIYARIASNDLLSGAWTPISFDTDGASTRWAYLGFAGNQLWIDFFDGAETTVIDSFVPTVNTFYQFFAERNGTTVTLQIDNRSAVTGTITSDVTMLNNLTIGAITLSGGAAYQANSGQISDVCWKTGAHFVGSEKADIKTYIAGR